MSPLKKLVNNKDLWEDYSNYIDHLITQEQRVMEQASDNQSVWRKQGSIHILRKLKKLKDEVNTLG